MADVILSERAKTDLDSIDRFGIQAFGSDVAADYMAGFREIFERLSEFPESGSIVGTVRLRLRS